MRADLQEVPPGGWEGVRWPPDPRPLDVKNVLSALRPETPKTLGQTLGVSGLAGELLASAEGRCGVGFQFQ